MLFAVSSTFATGAVLTFAIPIGTFVLAIAYAFHQRKPPAQRSRRSLFPSEGLPQRVHDLQILAAMSRRARAEITERADTGTPLVERPLGGR